MTILLGIVLGDSPEGISVFSVKGRFTLCPTDILYFGCCAFNKSFRSIVDILATSNEPYLEKQEKNMLFSASYLDFQTKSL